MPTAGQLTNVSMPSALPPIDTPSSDFGSASSAGKDAASTVICHMWIKHDQGNHLSKRCRHLSPTQVDNASTRLTSAWFPRLR